MRDICDNEFFAFSCEIESFENKEVCLEYDLSNYFALLFSSSGNMYEHIIQN